MTEPVVSLVDVRREYLVGDQVTVALNGINLQIMPGEFVAIIGPSGSGKSTMMNLIGCLDRPSTGQVKVAGKNISQLNDNELTNLRSRSIGFVFQQFQLLSMTSALDNVAAPLMYQGEKASVARKRAKQMLTRLGLGDRLNFDRTRLSGGQQQRVAIARALVSNPAIVLADEPTGALDSASGAQVMKILTEMHEDGRTVVLITHDKDIAAFAKRRIYLRDGKIEKDETSQMQVLA